MGAGSVSLSRRAFLFAGAAATLVPECVWAAKHGADYSFDEVVKKIGWSANEDDAFFFLHVTDLHSSEVITGALKMPHKFEGKCFVDDMNALPLKPAFAVITGDMISEATMNPRCWPAAEQKWARYKRIITDRLTMPWHQIIGNNDCPTPPYKKIYPSRSMYWSFVQGGILFVGLHGYNCWKVENTNHAGILYDDEQLKWLKKLVAASHEKTLVIFTHEPLKDNDQHCARRQLAPILDTFPGKYIWNVCGHNHSTQECVITIGSREVRSVESLTPVGSWVPGDGIYRLLFCHAGEIVNTAYRWLDKDGNPFGFALNDKWNMPSRKALLEDTMAAGALEVKLVGASNIVWGECKQYEDRISNMYIRRGGGHVTFRLGRKDAERIRIACAGSLEGSLAFSCDGNNWNENAVTIDNRNNVFALPPNTDWVRITNTGKKEFKFCGFALLRKKEIK